MLRSPILALLIPLAASAAVIDRVAVVVGSTVITESEVLDAVRLTEFVNGEALDLGPRARRAAAERLVDQQLIRNEMELGRYTPPPASDADRLLGTFRQQRFPSAAQYEQALKTYGITEDELKSYLLWQETVLRFTDMRFRPGLPGPSEESANRLQDGATAAPGDTVDERLDAWLKESRENTRIIFKPEAFQ